MWSEKQLAGRGRGGKEGAAEQSAVSVVVQNSCLHRAARRGGYRLEGPRQIRWDLSPERPKNFRRTLTSWDWMDRFEKSGDSARIFGIDGHEEKFKSTFCTEKTKFHRLSRAGVRTQRYRVSKTVSSKLCCSIVWAELEYLYRDKRCLKSCYQNCVDRVITIFF